MKKERREFITFLGVVAVMTVFAALSNVGFAHAAEIKVLSSPAVRGVVSALGQEFEGATGHKLTVEYDVFAALKRRIDAGELFDIAILSPDLIDELIKLSKVAADSRADLGRHGTGLGMRKGAPKPDISSVETFKRTMLNAKSVAYFREGTSGLHFLSILDRLGIATDMKPKLKAYDSDSVAQALLTGEAEFVVAGIGTILALPAVEVVGGLPPELQSFVAYAAGVSAAGKQPEAARALIRFLTGQAAAQVITSRQPADLLRERDSGAETVVHFYVLPSDRPYLQDASIPVVFIEAEKSKLAITALSRRMDRPLFAIGLGGCNGWSGKVGNATTPNGERVDQKGPISDFDHIAWADRKVIVCLDSNVETNPNVRSAELRLKRELVRRGATVCLARIPEEVNGPDDYLALHDDDAFLRLLDKASEHPEARLRVVTLPEFLSMTFPPREFILDPIIHRQGTVMIHSKRGIGKTYLSLAIGCAVAAGVAFLKWKASKPRKVVYVDGEMPATSMQERLASLVTGMDIDMDPEYFRLITPDLQEFGIPSLSGTLGQSLVEDQLDGAELVILDNLSTLATGGKENEAESWLPIQEWVLSLRRRGVSVLFDHHAGKAGTQRGTSRREDILDTVIALRHPDDYNPADGARFEVHFEKARNIHGADVEPFEVRMETQNGAAIWLMNSIENITQVKASALFSDGLSVRDVAKELNISRSKAHRLKLLKFPKPGGENV